MPSLREVAENARAVLAIYHFAANDDDNLCPACKATREQGHAARCPIDQAYQQLTTALNNEESADPWRTGLPPVDALVVVRTRTGRHFIGRRWNTPAPHFETETGDQVLIPQDLQHTVWLPLPADTQP